MICSCPKCDASIDVELSRTPSAGHYTPCPSCKSRFWVQKESFINRAFKKEGNIYCASCDAELGLSHVCTHCTTLLPDYILVQKTKPPKRKVESSGFSLDFSLTSGGGGGPSRRSSGSGGGSKALFIKLAVVAVAVVAIAAVGFYIKKSKEESSYVVNYVRALYAVKSGVDKNLASFVKMKEAIGFAMSSKEITVANTVNTEIDERMSLLEKTPEKFTTQKDQLVFLLTLHKKLFSLINSPTASSNIDKAIVLEADFNKAAVELKSTLPPEIKAEIINVSARYKNLGIFID